MVVHTRKQPKTRQNFFNTSQLSASSSKWASLSFRLTSSYERYMSHVGDQTVAASSRMSPCRNTSTVEYVPYPMGFNKPPDFKRASTLTLRWCRMAEPDPSQLHCMRWAELSTITIARSPPRTTGFTMISHFGRNLMEGGYIACYRWADHFRTINGTIHNPVPLV